MIALALVTAVVAATDQFLTQFVRRGLRSRAIRLGPFGELRAVDSQMWLSRGSRQLPAAAIWFGWAAAAICLTVACARRPQLVWYAGLLLGGSLSHAIETQRTGRVCDYICLRFWPAFDAADVALAIGACGIAIELLGWMRAFV